MVSIESDLISSFQSLSLSKRESLHQVAVLNNTFAKIDTQETRVVSAYVCTLLANPTLCESFFRQTRGKTYSTPVKIILNVAFKKIQSRLVRIQEQFLHITSLKVESSANFSKRNFQLLSYPHTLEELDVSNTNFDSKALEVMLNRCPHLKRLNTKNCSKLTTSAFYKVILPSTLEWYSEENKHLKSLDNEDPDHPLVLKDLAFRHLGEDQCQSAVEKVLLLLPRFAYIHEVAAMHAQKQREYWTARKHFEMAFSIDSTKSISAYFLSDFLIDENKLDEAKSCLESALKVSPNCWFCNWQMGKLLYRLGESDRALVHACTAVRLAGPDRLERSSETLSYVLYMMKHWDDAKNLLQEALQKFPNNAQMVFRYACILFFEDNFKDAEPLLQKAIEQEPTNWLAHACLSQIKDTLEIVEPPSTLF